MEEAIGKNHVKYLKSREIPVKKDDMKITM